MLISVIAFVLDLDLINRHRRHSTTLSAGDELAIEQTVRTYNKIYQDFYATGGNPKLLDSFPTSKDLRHFTYRDLGYLQDAGLVLVHDLADFEMVSISVDENGVEAEVREEWNYIYQSATDRSPVSDLRGMTFEGLYHLENDSGRWLITGREPVIKR
jgi:hypothetical protein